MGHRTVKRVPLDFEWPINEVWSGYLMPESLRLADCPVCEGDGLTVEARAVDRTFYPHMISGRNADTLAWCDKIGQAEVDNLLAEGRLRTPVPREPTEDNPRDWEWLSLPRDAADVNAAQKGGAFGGHDAINRGILVRFRCERLDIPMLCATCGGEGEVATEGQRAAHEAWVPTEPPAGEGWQLWETVSEGSPQSPVFASAEALADWCEGNATWFGSNRWTREEWLRTFIEDTTDVESLLVIRT